MNRPALARAPRYFSVIAGVYAIAGGGLSLLGWLTGNARLIDWRGDGITIKANATIAIIAAGSAVLCLALKPPARRWLSAVGLFIGALGAATLFEHITGVNLGLDTILFKESPGALATSAAGRMGPPACLSFMALGAALYLRPRCDRGRTASVALSILVLGIVSLSLIGYWYGAVAMYTLPRVSGIAFQATSMILAVSLALIALTPDREPMKTLLEDSNPGVLARRFVPLAFVVPLALGWLCVQGQKAGLFDTAFGSAGRSFLEVAVLNAVLWWCLTLIRGRDRLQGKVQEELRNSERRLADTLDSIADGFAAFDSEWRFTFVNAEAERLLRRPRTELIGRVLWQEFPHLTSSPFAAALYQTASTRQMIELEGADLVGGDRHFAHRLYPSADGGVTVYFHDVTLRKRTQDALQEADRRKDHFLATLAHELRNPLAPIRNATAVLLKKAAGDSTQKWGAEIIHRQVQHMARLLEDLLDVSRISRNRLELRKERIELAPVIGSAVEASRPQIDGARHTLSVELPAEVVYLDGDPIRLTQVFSNVLNNSAKYTEPGGHIRLTASCEGNQLVVRISDTGIGIEPEWLPQVFEMFSQASPFSSHSQGGLGFGLALARGILELHGGRIEARSAGRDQGSEFILTIPRLSDTTAGGPGPTAPEPTPASARRVLVVDDQKDNADTLSVLLGTLGHHVHTAYTGVEALEAADAHRPEFIFLDLGMPGIDGFEVCRRIRQRKWDQQPVVIAVTGWGQPEDLRRSQSAGFDDHLVKPIDAALLPSLLAQGPRASG